jgi:hypothetical protein
VSPSPSSSIDTGSTDRDRDLDPALRLPLPSPSPSGVPDPDPSLPALRLPPERPTAGLDLSPKETAPDRTEDPAELLVLGVLVPLDRGDCSAPAEVPKIKPL